MISTLKKRLIWSYIPSTEVKDSDLSKNSIIIVTPFGIVSGKLLDYNNEDNSKDYTLFNQINKLASETFREENESIPGNNGFIPLKEVTITSSTGAKYNLPALNVFYDQVIGITIGTFNNVEDSNQ